jgi:hypothetical protein
MFVELVQKGRVGPRTWRADDGTASSGARLEVAVQDLNEGQPRTARVLFFLGQQHQRIAPCVVYEFDFDRRGSKTYQPSFVID